jgi:hypothetical protein
MGTLTIIGHSHREESNMGDRRRRLIGICAFLAMAGSLAACYGRTGGGQVSGQPLDAEHRQARDALQRWADAVTAAGGQQGFAIVGEATGMLGGWEVAVGGNNKLGLIAGKVVSTVGLSDATPALAEVRWKDGTFQTLPTISAAQALKDLQASGVQACPDCMALKVTAAKLTTAEVTTSRGLATAPAWEFSLEGTAVHLTRIAIANVKVTPPPWDPNNAPVGLSIDSASGTVGETKLIVSFVGAPEPASKPCGADYDAEAVESASAVVIIVTAHRNPFPGACTLVGATRTATVELASPLADRAVLEVKEGLPVPVTLAP